MDRHEWLRMLTLLLFVCGVACVPVGLDDLNEPSPDPTPTAPPDQDSDGYPAKTDCNDEDPDIYPGAKELCDGLDNDCDDQVDDSVDVVSYPDVDLDGFGDVDGLPSIECPIPEGYVTNAGDCNDGDASIHVGAEELCDELDSDCNGLAEPLLANYYPDSDGDGFGKGEEEGILTCTPDAGMVPDNSDCDDTDAGLYPALVDAALGTLEGDGSVAHPYLTVQAGVNFPGSCRVVVVRPGTYSDTTTVDSVVDLTIKSSLGAEQTILEGVAGARALSISLSKNIVIEGFTLRATEDVAGSGAALLIYRSPNILLKGLIVQDSEALGTDRFGGGVGVAESEQVHISDSRFYGNKADYGGAIGLDDAQVFVDRSYFEGNKGDILGGAIAVGDVSPTTGLSQAVVTDCTFVGNSATLTGSAIMADLNHVLEVRRSTFKANVVTTFGVGYAGGALYNPSVVQQSYFLENTSKSYGGALLLRQSAYVWGNLFWRNSADVVGGAVDVYESSAVFGEKYTDVLILNNTFVDNAAPSGNAVYYYDAKRVTIRNNIFYDGVSSNVMLYSLETLGELVVDHNDFFSARGSSGTVANDEFDYLGRDGNFAEDPLFVAYSASDDFRSQDFHLLEGSPCIGAGSTEETGGEETDLGAYGGPYPLE